MSVFEKSHDLVLAHIFQYLSYGDIKSVLKADPRLKTILDLPKTRLLTKQVIADKKKFKLILHCNQLPDYVCDDVIWRRLRVLHYKK